MVATSPKETLSNMEQMPMELFCEALAVLAIKRALEQSYVGAMTIYLDYSYMERMYRVLQLWRCCEGFCALAKSWFTKKLQSQEMRIGFVQGQHHSVNGALLFGKGTALKMCKEAPCIFSLGLRSSVPCLQITLFLP